MGGLENQEKNQTHRHFRDDHVTSPLLKFTCLKASVQTTFTFVISQCCCGRNRDIISHSHWYECIYSPTGGISILLYTHQLCYKTLATLAQPHERPKRHFKSQSLCTVPHSVSLNSAQWTAHSLTAVEQWATRASKNVITMLLQFLQRHNVSLNLVGWCGIFQHKLICLFTLTTSPLHI